MEQIREALRQVIEGEDFMPPARVLGKVKDVPATLVLPGMPYSLATNVLHADIWNRVWLARLQGLPKVNPFPDFPAVAASDWAKVRSEFLDNLSRAYDIACAEPFVHSCRSEETAQKLLLKIATHSTYHVGQMTLLKRALRGRKIAGG